MTDNGNQPRLVRTLTVKNFSVIKEAKLEFGKITVLIGPQSSGKSLLCKLAYFLGKELIDHAMNSILVGNPWEQFVSTSSEVFRSRFDADGSTFFVNSTIRFESGKYTVWNERSANTKLPKLRFGAEFKAKYTALVGASDPDRPTPPEGKKFGTESTK
jgi:AAA15 family ATPase/GTPase